MGKNITQLLCYLGIKSTWTSALDHEVEVSNFIVDKCPVQKKKLVKKK